MEAPEPKPQVRSKQLALFSLGTTLSARVGEEVFRSLPAKPGVYFFHDGQGALLYIGQSCDLRARVGSYRHVSISRHPKRTLRLVHRIARIEWQECATAAEAVEVERTLLLEKRPPYNRAGVWQGDPWWLCLQATDAALSVHLTRDPWEGWRCFGPLPSAFRYAHPALMRCLYRCLFPGSHLSAYPMGLLEFLAPKCLRLSTVAAAGAALWLEQFISNTDPNLPEWLLAMPMPEQPLEREYWLNEIEVLNLYRAKRRPVISPRIPIPVEALPLFPGF